MISRWFWGLIWYFCDMSGISLGKYTPWVFGKMIGAKSYKRID